MIRSSVVLTELNRPVGISIGSRLSEATGVYGARCFTAKQISLRDATDVIKRYTLKFGPAVSAKEFEKTLNEGVAPDAMPFHKLKARIELICDFDDVKKVKAYLESLAKRVN